MKKIFLGIVVVALLLLLGWSVSFFFTSSQSAATNHDVSKPAVVELAIGKTSGRPVPEGDAEYYNAHYQFSVLYPSTLTPGEHSEQGGGLTATFEDIKPKTVAGFQIFITPFSGTQITEERFKEDNPSGVREKLKNISVDGAVGASFYSTDAILGATYEVWFLRGGYLYEVTTFKELDIWLDSIVQTWKFIQ